MIIPAAQANCVVMVHAVAVSVLMPPIEDTELMIVAGGYCGYGPDYCGEGCVSNCDAGAECGEFAKPVNKTCPLNTCCSQYGFCGITEEFCGKGCQSHCVLHPKPPGGSAKGKTLSRVIGYYEAWNARSKCHKASPLDLPVGGLTHLNYAFAYIDPTSFEITTMDAATPISLFDEVAALKIVKPSLQLYVSIGGWTFSDNNTITQPIFGNIARSPANRRKFADNILSFLNQYGFDGVDIDWEYPGAPDRGGKEEDTENFVLLMKKIRETFDKSGRKLGITFTGPSSYWYMRWFDLPGLLKYSDWMNLMSYDLHGVWDRDNPIGSIVQGHTNLTEIKTAVELLWRVKVPPSKIVIGFGFYGRAFTLQNPSCGEPGCPFSAGAKPGVCTGQSGYLSQYEIRDILNKNSNSKRSTTSVTHDKEAAVKYFSWDSNQWISYDDEDTFKQKVDWADEVGFSGSLIWASDLVDDYDLTAHKALTGNSKLVTARSFRRDQAQKPLVDDLNDFLGRRCFKFKDTVDLENPQVASCSPYVKMGYDKAGCKGKDGECGKPICCPMNSGLKDCQWRGSGGDCNGRCHAGEVHIASSSWGGTPGQSGTGRCSRGGKALCCKMGMFDDFNENCYWSSGVGSSCKEDEESLAYMWDRTGWGTVFKHGNHFCCPKSQPMPYKNCHWVGEGDCADNTCNENEVTLEADSRGDSYIGCSWYREKSLCCTPNLDVLKTLKCDVDTCTDNEACDDESGLPDSSDVLYKRSYQDGQGRTLWSYGESGLPELILVPPRPGSPRTMFLDIPKLLGTNVYGALKMVSRPYKPGLSVASGDGASTLPLRGGFRMLKDVCGSTAVQYVKLSDLPMKGFHAEHLQEIQMVKRFLQTAVTGYLPSGAKMKSVTIDPQKLLDGWNKLYDVTLPRIGAIVSDKPDWTPPLTPNDRVFEIIGSYAYRTGMSILPRDMNYIKKNLVGGAQPMAISTFNTALRDVAKGDMEAAKLVAGKLQKTIGIFNYLNDGVLRGGLDKARRDLAKEIAIIGQFMPGLEPLSSIWKEFETDLYAEMVAVGTAFVLDSVGRINSKFYDKNTMSNPAAVALIAQANLLKKAIDKIRFDP
ncbi:bacteriodes thetaiotaomicron symbiotic chitinase [Blastomyces dermatitidis ER-3]|uniref:chitinase n=3 Tax=Ajellomyces dermatitidis TaxID=5039 RepID=F2TIC3_AJEDA|nr:bacteriodes thetaiotaomicron symbiotic chitinase [Blastomyces dermatitidis ER-3]EGE82986.2 hypothetical protein BDDG_05930 [Blastomyces dermatitidis ATCC 18188]OAT02123.1 bacteriodes thetaiotaomicron symbiotic chitinase [Blastomyces dermatitidis ER-3]